MRKDPVEAALARLSDIPTNTAEGKAQFEKALAGKSNLVVAKAARIVANARWSELCPDLAAAFRRFIDNGPAADKACAATIAIARALIDLDFDNAELFLRGMRHVQMEGSYGPPVDAAAELRGICAMGLANSTFSGKAREIVPLLVDREWQARSGAIRALAAIGSESAGLLVRLKALTGDRETEVVADCFSALLSMEGASAISFVAEFTRTGSPEIRDAALLAIGATRRTEAITWLISEFERTASTPARKTILLALSSSRTDDAIDFLIGQIRTGSATSCELAIESLEIHSRDESLRERVDRARIERREAGIS